MAVISIFDAPSSLKYQTKIPYLDNPSVLAVKLLSRHLSVSALPAQVTTIITFATELITGKVNPIIPARGLGKSITKVACSSFLSRRVTQGTHLLLFPRSNQTLGSCYSLPGHLSTPSLVAIDQMYNLLLQPPNTTQSIF